MNILKNKNYIDYDNISRYTSIPFYYHSIDNKYIYGITKHLNTDTDYVLHPIKDSDTLDFLSLKYYGRPDLYWIIADFNRIQDPFISLYPNYKSIKIPSLSNLSYEV